MKFSTDIFLYFLILQETHIYIKLRDYCIYLLTDLSDEDILKRSVMDLLDEWNQQLLNDFSDGCWARTSSKLRDSSFSLVYVSKSKFHGEHLCIGSTQQWKSYIFFFFLIHLEMRISGDTV